MGSKARLPLNTNDTDAEGADIMASVTMKAEQVPTQNTNKDVIKELAGEALGIEKGFLRTLIDLRKKPADVVESYLRGEHTYLNPFRLQFSIAAVWAIVMNFILDWYTIGQEYGRGINGFVNSIGIGQEKSAERLAELEASTGFMFDALFAKYFVVLVIVLIPLQALLCTRYTRHLRIPLKYHLSVLAYQGSLKMMVGFFLALGFGVHVLATLAVMFSLLAASMLGVRLATNLISGIPVERFFREHTEEIDKAYKKSGIVLILGSVVFGMIVGGMWAILGHSPAP